MFAAESPPRDMHPWLLYFHDEKMETSFLVSRFAQAFVPTIMLGAGMTLVHALAGMLSRQHALLLVPSCAAALIYSVVRCALTMHRDQARACWLYRMLTLVTLPCVAASVGLIQRCWPQEELDPAAFILVSSVLAVHALAARLDHTPCAARWIAFCVNWLVWLSAVPALSGLGHHAEVAVVVACTLLGEAAGFPLERTVRLVYLRSHATAETELRAQEAERLALELRVKARRAALDPSAPRPLDWQISLLRSAPLLPRPSPLPTRPPSTLCPLPPPTQLDAQAEVISCARSIRRDLGLAQLPREIAFASLSIKQKLGSGGFGIVYRASCVRRLPLRLWRSTP